MAQRTLCAIFDVDGDECERSSTVTVVAEVQLLPERCRIISVHLGARCSVGEGGCWRLWCLVLIQVRCVGLSFLAWLTLVGLAGSISLNNARWFWLWRTSTGHIRSIRGWRQISCLVFKSRSARRRPLPRTCKLLDSAYPVQL